MCNDNWTTAVDLSHVAASCDGARWFSSKQLLPLTCDERKVERVLCSWSVQTVVVMNACIIGAVSVTGLPLRESDSSNGAPIITDLSTEAARLPIPYPCTLIEKHQLDCCIKLLHWCLWGSLWKYDACWLAPAAGGDNDSNRDWLVNDLIPARLCCCVECEGEAVMQDEYTESTDCM